MIFGRETGGKDMDNHQDDDDDDDDDAETSLVLTKTSKRPS